MPSIPFFSHYTRVFRSIKGVSKFGVYSDGKTLAVNGAPSGLQGEYALCFENSGGPVDPPPPQTDPSYQLYMEAGGGGGAAGGGPLDSSTPPTAGTGDWDGGHGVVNPMVEAAPLAAPPVPTSPSPEAVTPTSPPAAVSVVVTETSTPTPPAATVSVVAPTEAPLISASVSSVTEGVSAVSLASEYVVVPEAQPASGQPSTEAASQNHLSALERLSQQHTSPDVVSISHPSLLGGKKY